jgi:pseudouridine synthase
LKRQAPPRKANPHRPKLDWLSRALGRAGVIPPDDIDDAIRAGRVSVDGKRVLQPMTPVRPDQKLRVDGQPVSLEVETRVLMFHKPAGVVTSSVSQDTRSTVYDALRANLSAADQKVRWQAAGRLDVETTGLLLFTNDEHLLEHVTSPDVQLAKRYIARVQGTPKARKLDRLKTGVELDDGFAKAESLEVLDDGSVAISISEGRNHQVKRMLAAVGYPVTQLHRDRIGTLVLDVSEGHHRELEASELAQSLGFVSRR